MGTRKYTNKEYEILAGMLEQCYGEAFTYREAIEYVDENISDMSLSALTRLEKLKRKIIEAPLEEMPLLINAPLRTARILSKWRLMIGK